MGLNPGGGVWLVGWAGQIMVEEDRIFLFPRTLGEEYSRAISQG